MAAVEVEGLVKRFGTNEALRGVDFAVPDGSILGLLGPNGAGKTTCVRILATLLRPDGGHARVDGLDVVSDAAEVRTRIGLTGQYAAVEDRLTGRENLVMVGRLFHMTGSAARSRADELLARFELSDAADRVVKGYSGGMRRRLDIAMSLIARPSVLFLDEPTTGLDPRSRLGMWDLIEELRDDGTTTLLTTQYLEEADRLADSIVVIDHGRVIAAGTTDQLKDRVGGDRIAITLNRRDQIDAAVAVLGGLVPGEVEADELAASLVAPVRSGGGITPKVIRAFDAAGIETRDMEIRRPTLDDVFLILTGHRAEDDAAEPAGRGSR